MSLTIDPPSLDAAALLALCEEGVALEPTQRALTLLHAAFPQTSLDDWAQVSIGRRDEALLVLRESLFGDVLDAAADCPGCEDELELSFNAADLRGAAVAQGDALVVRRDGYEVRSRLPTSVDLLDVAACGPSAGADALLVRCVQSARRDDGPVAVGELPGAVVEDVVAGMALADPLADIEVAVLCPACARSTVIAFDIVAYLWGEIEDWAQRLCHEVHALACRYGWSERDILSMSAQRRARYLELQDA